MPQQLFDFLSRQNKLRLGSLLAVSFAFLLVACDGYLAISGSLVSSEEQALSKCEARIEAEDGTAIQDWEQIDPIFTLGNTVQPGRDGYYLLLHCPGYYPVLRRVRSGGIDNNELGEISLDQLRPLNTNLRSQE